MREIFAKSFLGGLVILTLISGFFLSSHIVSAEEINDTAFSDDVALSIPSACTMTGSGMNSHTAEIPNGTYRADIGTTTINAYCNDPEGFAIYAIGYTDDTDGINVLKDSSLSSTFDIVTGTATSGETSNWSMKLSPITNPTPTYPITIESDQEGSFSSYHSVPSTYTKVAKRTSGTDVGENATGTSLTTTYASFIGPTQAPGTYIGQVKYVMVHPNYVNQAVLQDAVTVVFDGNGLTFPDGSTTNTVKYANVCKPAGYGYVGQNASISKTPNVNNDGTATSGYAYNFTQRDPVTISGADKLKIVLDYGIETDYDKLYIFKGVYNGEIEDNLEAGQIATFTGGNGQDENQFLAGGATTLIVDGDTVTFAFYGDDYEDSGYYGYYAKVYPVYNTQQPGTTGEEFPSNDCSVIAISGGYLETAPWNGKWTATIDEEEAVFEAGEYYRDAQDSLNTYLLDNYASLRGKTLTLYSYNPVTFDMVYAAANKTKVNNYYAIQDLSASMCADVTVEQTTTVIDIRDNTTYSIGKFKDGNCWMRDNLRLDPTDSTTALNMSASNTNATNDAIYNYLHGGNPNSITGWTDTAVSSPSDWPNSTYIYPYINVSNNGLYGAYYNYCAVSVGTNCYAYNQGQTDASYDVCPSNWALPTNSQLLSERIKTNALNVIGSGEYFSGSVSDETDVIMSDGEFGYFWGSTRINSTNMSAVRCLVSSNSSCQRIFSNQYGQNRIYGLSVRCILDASE